MNASPTYLEYIYNRLSQKMFTTNVLVLITRVVLNREEPLRPNVPNTNRSKPTAIVGSIKPPTIRRILLINFEFNFSSSSSSSDSSWCVFLFCFCLYLRQVATWNEPRTRNEFVSKKQFAQKKNSRNIFSIVFWQGVNLVNTNTTGISGKKIAENKQFEFETTSKPLSKPYIYRIYFAIL